MYLQSRVTGPLSCVTGPGAAHVIVLIRVVATVVVTVTLERLLDTAVVCSAAEPTSGARSLSCT